MELLICCAILLVTVVLVFLSARHSLRTMDENAGRAMKQIRAPGNGLCHADKPPEKESSHTIL